MAQILSISIDVTKIDKTKLIVGKKGTYLNLSVAVNDEKDQFDNDCSAWINQSKEEREAKDPKTYLGNGKVVWSNNSSPTPVANVAPVAADSAVVVDHDLPF